jgi:hypothetical protein
MSIQNIEKEVIKITKPLSLEDINDIFYKIILEKKLEQSEEDIKNGKGFSTEQVKAKLEKWLL